MTAVLGQPQPVGSWKRNWRASGLLTRKCVKTQMKNARKVTEEVLVIFPNSSTMWRNEFECKSGIGLRNSKIHEE